LPADERTPIVVLIPAYRPSDVLVSIVTAIASSGEMPVVVVNDGSPPAHDTIFDKVASVPNVRVLRHAINLGKGAALKTGLNFVLVEYPGALGAVTADADGQHDPDDVMSVARALAAEPNCLVLGVRGFHGDVPLRSRLGNALSRGVVRLVMGQNLADTQTGLRGVPRALMMQMLKTPSTGYDFELDMLITAKHQGYQVQQVPIRTIYEEGNRTSHFNPLVDSMKISFVLLRFSFLSLMTAVLDNCVFFVAYRLTSDILQSQVLARAVAVGFNYGLARRAVFLSDEKHKTVFPKYIALVLLSGTLSYALIELLTATFPIRVIVAKLIAESIVFFLNFAIQRDFVFTRRARTDAPNA
jgi:putative flippase GtrA